MRTVKYLGREFKLVHETRLADDLDLIFVCRNICFIEILRMRFMKFGYMPNELKTEYMLLTDAELGLIAAEENEEALPLAR